MAVITDRACSCPNNEQCSLRRETQAAFRDKIQLVDFTVVLSTSFYWICTMAVCRTHRVTEREKHNRKNIFLTAMCVCVCACYSCNFIVNRLYLFINDDLLISLHVLVTFYFLVLSWNFFNYSSTSLILRFTFISSFFSEHDMNRQQCDGLSTRVTSNFV